MDRDTVERRMWDYLTFEIMDNSFFREQEARKLASRMLEIYRGKGLKLLEVRVTVPRYVREHTVTIIKRPPLDIEL